MTRQPSRRPTSAGGAVDLERAAGGADSVLDVGDKGCSAHGRDGEDEPLIGALEVVRQHHRPTGWRGSGDVVPVGNLRLLSFAEQRHAAGRLARRAGGELTGGSLITEPGLQLRRKWTGVVV